MDALASCAVAERTEQCGGDHLLGGALRVVTRRRAVHDATAGHLRGADRTLTGTTGSLLLERLAAGTGDFTAVLGLVGALTGRSELRHDDLVDQRNVHLNVEDLRRQLDGTGPRAGRVENVDRGSHLTTLPSLRYGRRRCDHEHREPRP